MQHIAWPIFNFYWILNFIEGKLKLLQRIIVFFNQN
jgi:hypothetical protein